MSMAANKMRPVGGGLSLGFTGTQLGMSSQQLRSVDALVRALHATEYHHGDCIGADAEFHDIVHEFNPRARIIVHPPDNPVKRAFKSGGRETFVAAPKPYVDRNVDIVNGSDIIIATPKEDVEVVRSGTWLTIRRAHGLEKPVIIVFRNGALEWRT